jgi:hypothetical protein
MYFGIGIWNEIMRIMDGIKRITDFTSKKIFSNRFGQGDWPIGRREAKECFNWCISE